LFEKQVEASKECLLELVAISKEDKKTFEQDSKDLRQQLVTIQAELHKTKQQAQINLESQLEDRLADVLNTRSIGTNKVLQEAEIPISPSKKSYQKKQAQFLPVSPKKYAPKKRDALDEFDEYVPYVSTETYKGQSRDDDDVVSLDSDIDTAALGDLTPEQQEALLTLDLSGTSQEVSSALKKVPGLTENQVALLLQVASSLAEVAE
jgi:hypothetical protein